MHFLPEADLGFAIAAVGLVLLIGGLVKVEQARKSWLARSIAIEAVVVAIKVELRSNGRTIRRVFRTTVTPLSGPREHRNITIARYYDFEPQIGGKIPVRQSVEDPDLIIPEGVTDSTLVSAIPISIGGALIFAGFVTAFWRH